jgi:hypothetical protein
MSFVQLNESMQRGELILIEGGLCRFHLRRDGQLTIHDLLSYRPGAGQELLARLKVIPGALCLLARVPADLAANGWYARRGFVLDREEQSRTGKPLNIWVLKL